MEKNAIWYVVVALVVGAIVGYVVKGQGLPQTAELKPVPSPSPMVKETSTTGWDLHIDAEKHFSGNEKMVAHHRCKQVAGLTECQLYDSDEKDAQLVGVEVVVDTKTYQGFSDVEKKLWHYHKEEIPKVNAKLPDLSPEEAAKVVKSLEETYGKIYLLWDPSSGNQPLGNPSVTVLH